MAKLTCKLIVAAALLATAGCAKKRPEVLPPAPGETTAPIDNTGAGNQSGTSVVPGSREDFQQSVASDTVNFALDSYDIDPQARSILDSQAAWLQRYPNVRITIEGHADERGTREYNLALGQRRANSARDVLVATGVSGNRLNVVSFGKDRPAALGSTDDAWAQNRRAVTVVR